jgi:hypothetical protein
MRKMKTCFALLITGNNTRRNRQTREFTNEKKIDGYLLGRSIRNTFPTTYGNLMTLRASGEKKGTSTAWAKMQTVCVIWG